MTIYKFHEQQMNRSWVDSDGGTGS